MFQTIPTYNRFRTLRLASPRIQGEDVFALQVGLSKLGIPCGEPDGIFGPLAHKAVLQAQETFLLAVDGLAGGHTQRAIALELAERVASDVKVPFSAFKGQLELESGYRLGNYSPLRSDGHFDAGVTQRNTRFTPPELGFDPAASIDKLGREISKHYDLFMGLPNQRRWALAQGAWNAPAYACFIAREEGAFKVTMGMTARPGTEARRIFEEYVENVSVYLLP
jgi:Putative peptidoglycan binding domain